MVYRAGFIHFGLLGVLVFYASGCACCFSNEAGSGVGLYRVNRKSYEIQSDFGSYPGPGHYSGDTERVGVKVARAIQIDIRGVGLAVVNGRLCVGMINQQSIYADGPLDSDYVLRTPSLTIAGGKPAVQWARSGPIQSSGQLNHESGDADAGSAK